AGGDHRAGQVPAAGGVVERGGGAEAGQHHVGALVGRALGEGAGELRGGGPHVVRHDHRRRVDDAGERRAHRTRHGGIEGVGDDAAHVVSIEDLAEVDHCCYASGTLYRATTCIASYHCVPT